MPGERDIHLWQTDVAGCAGILAALRSVLSPEEALRAARFHFRRHEAQFVVSRGLLRVLIGRYLDADAAQVQFALGSHGKPSLTDTATGLSFNVSHSDGLVVFAFVRNADVGVDVERVRADVAREHLAEQFFSRRETTVLRSVPVERQADAFFSCWTRKEAYLKARGVGLSQPLHEFDVETLPGWSLIDFVPRSGFTGAVAVEGTGWQLAPLDWAAAA